jgi:acyl-CoA reductase-like NAD-dependent aldehyde dehydrogenase
MTADGTQSGQIGRFAAHRRGEAVRLANYVGGAWRPADGADTLDDVDPATGEITALVPLSGAKQVREAVEAARAAQPEWRAVSPQRRARALLALRA